MGTRSRTSQVGDFIAAQRRQAQLSLRQLAELTGVSNPYLSQIERGLRKPSAEVLQQLSKALRISAETLYIQAGILDPDDYRADTVPMAILADPSITERQKQVLLDVYNSFVEQNDPASEPGGSPADAQAADAQASDAQATEPQATDKKE